MIVLYSAIFGASDSLKRAPVGHARCVCFTDELPTNAHEAGWDFVRYERSDRPRQAARRLKMTPHEHFPEADAWLWVDGSIEIRNLPLLMRDIGDAEIACFAHPDRQTCYQEGETVIRLKIAADKGKQQIRDALESYRIAGFAPSSLSTTGLFYRRNTPRVIDFNRRWREELNRFGTNDQVHVDYCAWRAGVPIKYITGHYRANPYAVYDQRDHHRRRQPQFLLEADCADYLA